jgi:conjugal transfer ATP-binding protein TraC
MPIDVKTAIKKFLNPMPDNKPISSKSTGPLTPHDIIAPPAIEVDFDFLKIGDMYFRTLFVAGYPRFVTANWLEPLISFDHTLEISMFIYPTESAEVLENLRRKVGEMEATIQSDLKRGRVIEPSVQIALEDALSLQQELAKGAERFFQFGLYVTIPAHSKDDLDKTTRQVESTLASLLIVGKRAILQMEDGFKTTLPMGRDRMIITRNMDTTSLATTFPFTTSELTANEGILYGINEHNDSLVIFDRFSLENANTVVFGKSGSGKSYAIKLEIMRSLMFNTEVIIIDPENEYESLTYALGGEYIRFSFDSATKINPFDLALLKDSDESELNQKILSLHGFFRVVMGELTPSEDAILDQALILTYKQKGITPDKATQKLEPPMMEDLYKVLIGMENDLARGLSDRIEKFVKGSLVGIFDQQTNIEIRNQLTVFSIRDLEDSLRPIAMYLILDYIWTRVRRDNKKRILVVDEAWYMMRYPDSAEFLNSIAKRARKYYLGVTTISQDVEDFLSVELGKTIIQNSSLQFLMKQSPAAIDHVGEVFYLSEGEKHLLLSADVGEGLLFAGPAHAAVRIIASADEHALATTRPQDIEARTTKPGDTYVASSPVPVSDGSSVPTDASLPLHFTTETVDEPRNPKEETPTMYSLDPQEQPPIPQKQQPAASTPQFVVEVEKETPPSGATQTVQTTPAPQKPPSSVPLFTVESVQEKTTVAQPSYTNQGK